MIVWTTMIIVSSADDASFRFAHRNNDISIGVHATLLRRQRPFPLIAIHAHRGLCIRALKNPRARMISATSENRRPGLLA